MSRTAVWVFLLIGSVIYWIVAFTVFGADPKPIRILDMAYWSGCSLFCHWLWSKYND